VFSDRGLKVISLNQQASLGDNLWLVDVHLRDIVLVGVMNEQVRIKNGIKEDENVMTWQTVAPEGHETLKAFLARFDAGGPVAPASTEISWEEGPGAHPGHTLEYM
jgi:hypothetical protein